MLTVEFDDEMILDEMLVSYYYSRRPTTVYHRFHKEHNGEMVMEYSRKLGLPKKVLNSITAYVRDNCSVLVALIRSNVVCPELEKVYDYFNTRFPNRYTDVKTMTEFARNQLILNSATLLIVSGHCGQNRPECDFSCSNRLFAIS